VRRSSRVRAPGSYRRRRLASAAAHLGVGLGAITTDVGVDIVSLGGTKNGLLGAEAIVVTDRDQVEGLVYLRKMNMQLASKMRFLSAQLVALYEGDLWLRSASHANAMASRLAVGLAAVPGVRITRPVEANGVFAVLPAGAAAALRSRFGFYDWNHRTGEVRLMCSFDTTEDDVEGLVTAIGSTSR
jgi:threonine aldolase